jgi:hypothetical protein
MMPWRGGSRPGRDVRRQARVGRSQGSPAWGKRSECETSPVPLTREGESLA